MSSPMKRYGLLPLACSVGLLAGCMDAIPQSGPDGDNVATRAASTTTATKSSLDLPYALVDIDSTKLVLLRTSSVPDAFHFSAPAVERGGKIGVGDVLDISIFEADTGGLFTGAPAATRLGNAITLPSQEVDREGLVVVPYAGRVRAAGSTPAELSALITSRLKAQALDPQVVVGFASRHSGSVSVLGDVNTATHFCLDAGGERLLGALARAGGPRSPDYETRISLERGGVVAQVKLSDITTNPSDNVEIAPGDTVYVSHHPDYFIALGATGQSVNLSLVDRRISFGSAHLTLADALARAGGLEDDRANAKAVFVFRYENPATLQAMRAHVNSNNLPSPVVYALNLRDPAGLFYASGFEVHPEDIIYASNASSTDLMKIETLLMPLVDAGVTAAVVR